MCNEVWIVLPLALDLLVAITVVLLLKRLGKSMGWRIILVGLVVLYVLVSPWILVTLWGTPFFLTIVYP